MPSAAGWVGPMTGSTSEGRLPKVRGPRGRLRLAKAARVRDYLLLEDALLRSRPAKVEVDAEAEVDAVRPTPMEVATVEERLPGRHVVARTSREECWYVPVCSFVDWERVRVGGSVLLHPECKAVVGVVEEPGLAVKDLRMEEPPQEDFEHIGGLVEQIREVKEAVEMPLIQPELYEEIGIKPPKGVMYDIYATFASSLPKCSDVFNFYFPFGCRGPLVLFVGWTCRLYGPPGTGKTVSPN